MRLAAASVLSFCLLALPPRLQAQTAKGGPSGPARATGSGSAASASSISGRYVGTATVQLGDSTIVVPVTYQFTGVAPAIGGSAVVPGQGSGAISHVSRDGARLRFRVSATPSGGKGKPTLLEHDGTVSADGTIEGFVNLDGQPVAKFRIAPGATPSGTGARPAGPETPRSKRGSTR
jgi:hypothetical protein